MTQAFDTLGIHRANWVKTNAIGAPDRSMLEDAHLPRKAQ